VTATVLRQLLRSSLKTALRQRDSVATRAFRSALAAIDNAEAVQTEATAGAIEAAAVGVGATEAPRRELSSAELRDILQHEVDERHTAADECAAAAPEAAERLRAEAQVIAPYVSDVV
jgi:hypothetical protein